MASQSEPEQNSRIKPEATAFARKYRHYGIPKYQPDLHLVKSLLTPLSPLNPARFLDPDQKKERENIEAYQKSRFFGFTTRMLIDLDAVSNRILVPSSLTNPLYPLLHRAMWILSPVGGNCKMQKGYGDETVWSMNNDTVWRELLPSLRLASRILEMIHSHPWFDAFLLGDEERIDPNRLTPSVQLDFEDEIQHGHFITMKLRVPAPGNLKECRRKLRAYRKEVFEKILRLGISSVEFDPSTGKKPKTSALAFTKSKKNGNIEIWFNFETFAGLLKRNSSWTDAEKFEKRCQIAQTLVHEVTHATRTAILQRRQQFPETKKNLKLWNLEPYFMEEAVAELGFSCEAALFGGIQVPYQPDKAPLSCVLRNWPNGSYTYDGPTLINPTLPLVEFAWPLPISWFEALFSQDYWNSHARSLGMIRPVSLLSGSSRPAERSSGWEVMTGSKFSQSLIPEGSAHEIQRLLNMSPEDKLEHEEAMGKTALERFNKLIQERDWKTQRILDFEEICSTRNHVCQTPHEEHCRLVGYLQELLDTHEILSLDELPKLERNGSSRFINTRNDILNMNRNLTRYISTKSSQISNSPFTASPAIENELQLLLHRVEYIRMQFSTPGRTGLNPVPDITNRKSAQDELYDEIDINQARLAFERGDKDTYGPICDRLRKSLGTNLIIRATAGAYLAYNIDVDLGKRLSLAKRALRALEKMRPPTPEWIAYCERIERLAKDVVDELQPILEPLGGEITMA